MLTLTDDELEQLERVMTTLLSPLDFDHVSDWGLSAVQSIQNLLRGDQALFGHALGGTLRADGIGPHTEVAARQYAEHFWTVDPGMTERRKTAHLEVYHRDEIYDHTNFYRTEIFADWCQPHHLFDAIGMSVELELSYPAAVHFYHDTESGDPFGERGKTLLKLLLPAYKAGVMTCWRLARSRSDVSNLFDRASDAILVVDASGREIHRNVSLTDLLARDPEGGRLLAEARRMAAGMLLLSCVRTGRHASRGPGGNPPFRQVRTAQSVYRLHGLLLGEETMGRRVHAAIVISAAARRAMSAAELRDRYGLTEREAAIARLLGAGRSTKEIAEALAISSHTARHHTENIMRKLGVHRRAEVGARLRGD